jgi:hypothetical protein
MRSETQDVSISFLLNMEKKKLVLASSSPILTSPMAGRFSLSAWEHIQSLSPARRKGAKRKDETVTCMDI